jgi:prepilin-type N-terminal cleavage/methylation domain-containing protein
MNEAQTYQRIRHGFTIPELAVSAAIVAVVAGIALPRVNLHQFRIEAAVRVIQTTLQQAEREAVKRQHNFVVSFDVAGKRLRILDDLNNNSDADAGERVIWRTLDDGVKFATPPAGFGGGAAQAVTGTGVKTVNGMPSLIYRRDGAASSDLQAFITSTRNVSADFRLLSITRATGRVDWYKYNGSTWKRGSI